MTSASGGVRSLPEGLVIAAPAALIATVFLARGLIVGPTLDGQVFALIGDGLLHGRVPYRDLWDHKPPGIYLLNATAGVVLPFAGAWARAWVVSWLSTVAALVGLAWLLDRAGIARRGIVLALLLSLPMVSAYHFALGGGQTESAGLGFAVAGIGMALRPGRRWRVAGGLALAAAMAISLQFVPAGFAAVFVLGRRRARVRELLELVAGVSIVPLAIVLWLGWAGALPAAIDSVITYNRDYLAVNQRFRVLGLLTATLDGLFLLSLIFAALVRVASFRRRGPGELEVAAGVWTLAWLGFTGVQGVFFDHYAITLAPALVILAAPALAVLLESIGQLKRAPLARTTVLTLLFVPPIVGTGLTEGSARAADSLAATSTAVQRLTPASDSIFVWGNEADIYTESDRPPASRYVYMFPLTLDGYVTPDLIGAILGEWLVAPPAVIVDATVNPGRVGGYPLSGASGEPGSPDAGLDPLRDFILSRYQLKESIGTWDLYTRRILAAR